MRYITLLFVPLLLGCTTVYTTSYDMALEQVERPAEADERYGPKKVTETDTSYVFEDEFIRAGIIPSSSFMVMKITNKTENSIQVPWNQGAYVGPDGNSEALIHGEMRKFQIGGRVAPTVIPPGADIVKLVSGSEEYDGGALVEGLSVTDARPSDRSRFLKSARAPVGKTVQLLMPFQIEDTVNEYIFHISVNDVTVDYR